MKVHLENVKKSLFELEVLFQIENGNKCPFRLEVLFQLKMEIRVHLRSGTKSPFRNWKKLK